MPVILATAPSGQRLPRRMRMWPVALIGFSSGWIDLLALGLRPGRSARFSASVLPVTVRQSPSSKPSSSRYFITAGVPPTSCRSSMHVLAAGLEVGEVRHAVADLLEVVDRQRHVDRAGHRDQVQHGIGRAAERHHDDHRVLERSPGHDVARLEVALEQLADRRAGARRTRRACRDPRPGSTSCTAATCPGPRSPRPSCWRCTCRRRRRRRDSCGGRSRCAPPR